jgi:hypothetical protein
MDRRFSQNYTNTNKMFLRIRCNTINFMQLLIIRPFFCCFSFRIRTFCIKNRQIKNQTHLNRTFIQNFLEQISQNTKWFLFKNFLSHFFHVFLVKRKLLDILYEKSEFIYWITIKYKIEKFHHLIVKIFEYLKFEMLFENFL